MLSSDFSHLVVDWFRREGRILPWRVGRDPYRIWISEIMLQQTRIEAVIPYYHRFLSALPNVSALSDCPEDELLKLWEGLGYYSRARNLKKAARMLMETYGGALPQEPAELLTLPGIGAYTAGAIASIAYGKKAPAVDGNVLRVLARVCGDFRDVTLDSTRKAFHQALLSVYPEGKAAGDLTEGIMEIGERFCIPNGAPLCEGCPLKEACVAFREGLWEQLPVKSPKKERRKEEMTVLLLSSGGKFALQKRPEGGLLSGMWEFYHLPGKKSAKEVKEHLEKEGFSPQSVKKAGSFKHVFTHLEWLMTGYSVICAEEKDALLWLDPETIRKEYAVPTAFRAFLKQLP